MRALVIDVAAEHGGAVSVLDDYINRFSELKGNEYFIVLSTLKRSDSGNVHFLNVPFVKKTYAHRMYFEWIYIKKLIRRIRPDYIFSLQNKSVLGGSLPQEVLFHNALFISEHRFSFFQSNKLWLYQNIISRIVKHGLRKKAVRKIIVQSGWIKEELNKQWQIPKERIFVEQPEVDWNDMECGRRCEQYGALFYPANGAAYKNHKLLLQACTEIWDERGTDCGLTLYLTGSSQGLTAYCRSLIQKDNYPIHFLGRLNRAEMADMYRKTALVFPSYIETVGLPILEAICFGCEIFAADCAYAKSAADGCETAHFFDPFDKNALKELILKYSLVEE